MKLLQVLPSIMREIDGELSVDVDFCEALRVYFEHFDGITVACPVTTQTLDSGLERCRLVRELPWGDRLRLIALPSAYGAKSFARNFRTVRELLRTEIKQADYLVFSPHTLIGDWPMVAAREAIKLGRPYVIEADVVYESVGELGLDRKAWWKRAVKRRLMLPLFGQAYRYLLRRSSLALFQGRDVYDAYAEFCSNPHKMHYHIPIYLDDHITAEQLKDKLTTVVSGRPIEICYAGRAVEMKGPVDWIDTINELIKCGVDLKATWLGDGSLLPILKLRAAKLGIGERVIFPGLISDKQELLRRLRSADIFLFCHKTQESARILGEALACGCPIIGYAGAYPAELVAQHGGGLFAGQGDWGQLAEFIQHLDRNRDQLCDLIVKAAASGRLHDRDVAMANRIDLVKRVHA